MYVHTQASRRRSPRARASASASPRSRRIRSSSASCRSTLRSSRRTSIASASVSGLSGRCASAASACSNDATASRLAERSKALVAALPRVAQRARPQLAVQRVVGQPLDVLLETVGIEPLEGRHDASVQRAPLLGIDAAVGHVVGEGVLEGVLDLGERSASRRGTRPPAGGGDRRASASSRPAGDGAEHRERHVLADDGGDLEQRAETLVEAMRAGEDDLLHGVGHRHAVQAGGETHGPVAGAADRAHLLERAHQLLDEERIALRLVEHEASAATAADRPRPADRRRCSGSPRRSASTARAPCGSSGCRTPGR